MKRILVAHDGSPLSQAVLEEAIALATAWAAKIRLVRAVPVPAVPIVDTATSSLRTAAKAIPPALRDGLSLDAGLPSRVVLGAARTYEADLIVVGAHAHGALSIVERAPIPVFVVRPVSDRVRSVVRRSCASAPA